MLRHRTSKFNTRSLVSYINNFLEILKIYMHKFFFNKCLKVCAHDLPDVIPNTNLEEHSKLFYSNFYLMLS